jgi:hypothetical protein
MLRVDKPINQRVTGKNTKRTMVEVVVFAGFGVRVVVVFVSTSTVVPDSENIDRLLVFNHIESLSSGEPNARH